MNNRLIINKNDEEIKELFIDLKRLQERVTKLEQAERAKTDRKIRSSPSPYDLNAGLRMRR